MSFPLEIAKLCIDCEAVFAGGDNVCIACGSKQWVYLSKYIKSLKENTNEKTTRLDINPHGN
jgi:predicted  nucleic acid-binding Zn-ribbon protein